MLKHRILIPLLAVLLSTPAFADKPGGTYQFDTEGQHQFILFKISHLGYSWLYGNFNEFTGSFTVDEENPENSKVRAEIKTASIDSNHAERDKHLRNEDFLDVSRFTEARFVSTGYEGDADGGTLRGELTMHGETRPIEIEVKRLGEGKDPWGGYRVGFVGTTTLDRRDFGIDYNLGPKGWTVELELGIEGKRQ